MENGLGDRYFSDLIRERSRVGCGLRERSGLGLLRLLSGPEVSDGNAMQVIRKGNNLCAGVKDNATHLFLAHCGCPSL